MGGENVGADVSANVVRTALLQPDVAVKDQSVTTRYVAYLRRDRTGGSMYATD